MEQAKHTKGPWRARFDAVIDVVAADAGRIAIATNLSLHARRDTDEVGANARLIAAAPDLLAVAQDFNEILAERGMFCECGEPDCRTTKLRAAIAKALGESA